MGSYPSKKCSAGMGELWLSLRKPLSILLWKILSGPMYAGRIGRDKPTIPSLNSINTIDIVNFIQITQLLVLFCIMVNLGWSIQTHHSYSPTCSKEVDA